MAIYRGTGGTGDSNTDSTISAVTTQAVNAANSASEASSSASSAATSATSATNSQNTSTAKASDAATSAAAALTSQNSAAADLALTNADVVLTNADVVSAEADKVQTGLDRVATAADVITSAASASTATTKASEAVSSASAASSSASAASTSESNAGTSETNAASAQTAAESARDTAVASYDSFDDRYLGAKGSAPTVDNDGSALITGALYFNTNTQVMSVWDGSAWAVIAPSAANQANVDIVAGNIVYSEDLGSISTAVTTSSGSSISVVAAAIADINRYATEYTIASSSPSSPSAGDLWYDSVANALKYYTGSVWAAISAGIASVAGDSTPQLGGALDGQNYNMTNIGTISGTNLQLDFGGL